MFKRPRTAMSQQIRNISAFPHCCYHRLDKELWQRGEVSRSRVWGLTAQSTWRGNAQGQEGGWGGLVIPVSLANSQSRDRKRLLEVKTQHLLQDSFPPARLHLVRALNNATFWGSRACGGHFVFKPWLVLICTASKIHLRHSDRTMKHIYKY